MQPTEFSPGITLQWLHNERIAVLTIAESFRQREVASAYYDKLTEFIDHWPEQHPILLLIDSSQMPITWSPYIRQRNEELAANLNASHRTAHTAIILPKSVLTQVIRVFIRLTYRDPKHQNRIFHDYHDALNWLEQALETKPPLTSGVSS